MMRSVSVIFDTGVNYSCSYNIGYFMDLDGNIFPRNIKDIATGLEISGFGIVKYYARSEIGRMISIRDQEYCVPGLLIDFLIISPQVICASEGYKGALVYHCHY